MSETTDQMIERMMIERPGFKESYERVVAETAQRALDAATQEVTNAQTAKQWSERKKVKFTDLSFVGKAYRSRNRRSAKVTAWAVKTEPFRAAAAQGVSMAMEFCQWTVDAKVAGTGLGLAQIIEGMADRLEKAKGPERWSEQLRIRGFCSVLETHAQLFAGHVNQPDLTRAQQQAVSMAMLDSWQNTQRSNVFTSPPDVFGGAV